MPIPASLQKGLALPVICAPMFIVSNPELVIAQCKGGVIGSFPALNARPKEELDVWLSVIKSALADDPHAAPFAVNQIIHQSNERLEHDMALCVKHEVPLIITSLRAPNEIVPHVHAYGGKVFHDVISVRHAEKALEAGVDGLILVANGAGGHAGVVNPFALINEVRSFYQGTIILAGCISTGQDVAAALMMGADFAYMGTRFIATTESAAQPHYKDLIVTSGSADITYTPAVSGIPANFLTPSLVENKIDPKSLPEHKLDMGEEAKAWKTIWSAGQGSGSIHDSPTTAQLVARLTDEFSQACDKFDKKRL